MRMTVLAMAVLALSTGAVYAQASGGASFGDSTSGQTLGKLVADGYEIKAAVPNGAKYVVFLQKENKAYACEFVTLSSSRCGEIR
ncbi:hypothetical protein E2A64_08440 [Pseudohoeflea suaedae]|uniref:Uncharacterized protein n=1 Tax=Pseudohoeflea suaedae TaxID=877384 RepID=A0A4R5PPQ4_9HYPH|nr:hypothetical protein [Pseudohoeflea suaedae]TDH39094.1 hypothetical protein E2A64_08440 [Pseudohoeflea suaedae]